MFYIVNYMEANVINKKEKGLPDAACFFKKSFKSIIYTAIIVLGVFIFDNFIEGKSYINGVLQSNLNNGSQIVSMGIGIIFTIIFCTFTILDELKKKN